VGEEEITTWMDGRPRDTNEVQGKEKDRKTLGGESTTHIRLYSIEEEEGKETTTTTMASLGSCVLSIREGRSNVGVSVCVVFEREKDEGEEQ